MALTGRFTAMPRVALTAGLLAYAVGSEVLQGLLPLGRTADPLDALTDALGVVLGIALARRLR